MKSPVCSALLLCFLIGPGLPRLAADDADAVRRLFEAGDFPGAAEHGLAALGRSPEDIDLQIDTGRALVRCGRWRDARPWLEQVVRRGRAGNWRTGWALFELARIEFAQGEGAAAREHARLAVKQAATPTIVREGGRFLLLIGDGPAYRGWTTHETRHLRIHFAPGMAGLDPARFAERREAVLAANQAFFAAKLPKKIDLYVWPDEATARRAGLAQVGFAVPWCSVIHALRAQTPGHEIVHVLHHHAFHPRTPAGLVGEGVAVLFDGQPEADRLRIAREAVQRAGVRTLSVAGLWREWPGAEPTWAYPVAGALVEMLRRRGGDAHVKDLLAGGEFADAERLYGDDLAAWLEEFERALLAP